MNFKIGLIIGVLWGVLFAHNPFMTVVYSIVGVCSFSFGTWISMNYFKPKDNQQVLVSSIDDDSLSLGDLIEALPASSLTPEEKKKLDQIKIKTVFEIKGESK